MTTSKTGAPVRLIEHPTIIQAAGNQPKRFRSQAVIGADPCPDNCTNVRCQGAQKLLSGTRGELRSAVS